MENVRELLNHIWSIFRKAGIADDFTIIENTATILLQDQPSLLESELQRIPGPDIEEIRRLLKQAAEAVGGPALLFDRYILFRLPDMLPGGRYPTPRHIVKSMLRIAEVGQEHHIADLACGSGGFLVHHIEDNGTITGQRIGIEISPEWAKLARTNIKLHQLTTARIEIDSALQAFNTDGRLARESFDRILMNLPFNEVVDGELARRVIGHNLGSRSETVLTGLALNKLRVGGRAAVLVSSSPLFVSSAGESELRKRLIDEYDLEAVISLPRDALQPFSPLQGNIVLVRKMQQAKDETVWFFYMERDGYPAGRSRNLTTEPTGPSDIPFVERVILSRDEGFNASFPGDNDPFLGIKTFLPEDGANSNTPLLGVVMESIGTAVLNLVELFPPAGGESAFLLAEITESSRERRLSIQVSLESGLANEVKDRDTLIRTLYKVKKNSDPTPTGELLFQGHEAGQAVAILGEGRLVGRKVPRKLIRERYYELRPSQYVGVQEKPEAFDSPATLIAQIWRDQKVLLQHVDSLLGRLELPPIAHQQFPPKLTEDAEPFGALSGEQRATWQAIRGQIETIQDNETRYETAKLFTQLDIQDGETAQETNSIAATLDLFERMGTIVSVTFTDPNTHQEHAFYRRTTERDQWDGNFDVQDSEKEDV